MTIETAELRNNIIQFRPPRFRPGDGVLVRLPSCGPPTWYRVLSSAGRKVHVEDPAPASDCREVWIFEDEVLDHRSMNPPSNTKEFHTMTTETKPTSTRERVYLLALFERMVPSERDELLFEARQILGDPAFTVSASTSQMREALEDST
jgi:hypothetical protein